MISRRENSLKFADSILNDIVRWVSHLVMIAGVIMRIKSMKNAPHCRLNLRHVRKLDFGRSGEMWTM